jgi:hypothetical protein
MDLVPRAALGRIRNEIFVLLGPLGEIKMPDDICPACKTKLDHTHSIEDPIWLNDPIKTPYGLSGVDYIGAAPVLIGQIQQLQIYYGNMLLTLGLTVPTWLDPKDANRNHIIQLRVCVELALDNLGRTLTDYFSSDKYGNSYSGAVQEDWTDCERIDGRPEVPLGTTIKAIHLEELRRGTLPGLLYYLAFGTISPNPDKFYGEVAGPTGPYITENTVETTGGMTGTFKGIERGPTVYFDQTGRLYYALDAYYRSIRVYAAPGTGSSIYTEAELLIFPPEQGLEDSNNFWRNTRVHSLCIGPSKIVEEDTGDEDYRLYVSMCKLQELHWPGDMPEYPNNYPEAPWYPYSQYMFPNVPYGLYEFRSPKQRYIGIGNGGVSQSFELSDLEGIDWEELYKAFDVPALVDPDNISKYFRITVGGTTWTMVDNFDSSGPTDKHYRIDEAGTLIFGGEGEEAGQQGAKPANGSPIKLWLSIIFANKNRWTEEALVLAPSEEYAYEFPQCIDNKKLILSKVSRKDVGYIVSQTNTTAYTFTTPTTPTYNGYGQWVTQCGGSPEVTLGIPTIEGMGEFKYPKISKDKHIITSWGDTDLTQVTGNIGSYMAQAFSTASVGHSGPYDPVTQHYAYYYYSVALNELWGFSVPSTGGVMTCDGHTLIGYTGSGSIPGGEESGDHVSWSVYAGTYQKTTAGNILLPWQENQLELILSLANAQMAKRNPSIVMSFANPSGPLPAVVKEAAQVYWNQNWVHPVTITYECG